MNWMGGARNRVKFQGERKIQQEFFDRQKLTASHSLSVRTSSKKKRGLSQDLVALHTVSQVHSHLPAGYYKPKPIKKVDLEKFQSCTRQIDEVDMGPCSPSQTPSKLLLNHGRLDRNVQTETDSRPSEVFQMPENILKYKTSGQNTGDPVQKVQTYDENSEIHVMNIKDKSDESPSDVEAFNQPKEFLFSKPKAVYAYEKCYKKAELGFNPFASEDFQVTPLVRYTKKRSANNFQVVKCKRKKHSEESNDRTEKVTKKEWVHSPKQQFTSTPVAGIYERSDFVKKSENFGSISPIFKGRTVDSGFKFKPRPMSMTPDLKYNKEKTPHCLIEGKFGKESGKEMMNLEAPSGMYGQKFQHFVDHEDSFKYNHGESKTAFSQQDDFRTDFLTLPCDQSQLCSTRSESVCSRSNITEDMYDSSVSRDSLQSGTDQGNSGSLSKYKHSIRHTCRNSKMSPAVNNDSDSFQQHDVLPDKNKMDSTIRTEISKPKFTDLEEDFHYKPMKPKVGLGCNIMNIYKKLENEKQIQIGTEKEDKMLDKNKGGRLSGGSIQEVPSPIPADEFPKHLLSSSKQLQNEIDRQMCEIVSDEKKKGPSTLIQMKDEDGAGSYKPWKSQMDDVLDEMNQLEEQDAATPDVSEDKDDKVTGLPPAPPGAVATESFEADAYIETEDLLLNADIEHMQQLREKSADQTSVSSQKENDTTDQIKQEMLTDAANDSRDSANYRFDKCMETESYFPAVTGNKSDKSDAMSTDMIGMVSNVSPDYVVIDANSEMRKDNYSTSELNNAAQFCEQVELKESDNRRESKITSCTDKSNSANSEERDVPVSRDTIQSIPSYDDKNTEIANNNGKTEGFCSMTDKAEADKTAGIKQLQVPEVSSGKNQFTQTDANLSLRKTFVEVAVSPVHELNVHNFTDAAIQCDLSSFPTLSDLAGKSLSIKSAKNSTSLCKPEERTSDCSILADDESKKQFVSERASAAKTYIEKLAANCNVCDEHTPSQ